MRFQYYAAFVGISSLCLAAKFDPITKPTKGETLTAGKSYTIKWNTESSTDTDSVNLLLESGNSTENTEFVACISTDTSNRKGHFKWNVSTLLSHEETYYIKIGSIDNANTFSYSPPFKIEGGSLASTNATGSSGLPTLTPSASSTTSASTSATDSPTSSTSSSGDVAATSVVPAPLAFVGAAIIGVWVL
ncbi:GPI anchored serine-threonine rich protein [Penicillium argentinense]|uniref:GPI anchored serine-threonine rich protein n=1 Tax=Penicillium argentinense TaxID=1131581 RepID=A0A9W9FP93_9EURO|nr:GPI anchored serine-threonine rich protein [Penicillium argentinense]KAJ5103857.1 GPI anchored serine-threonine rich protein [Penicillium argentinense]